ncbi:MAG: molybdopterin-dependent oxidoreductase [Dehalococcoidia bacterium]
MGDTQRTREGLIAGGLGAALAVAVSIGLGLATGTPSLPELLSDSILGLTPGQVFSFVLDRLQVAAKPLFYLVFVLGLVAIGSAIGGWFSRSLSRPSGAGGPSVLGRSLLLSIVLWLVQEVVLLPLAGTGFFGQDLRFVGALGPAIRLVGLFVYGLVLAGTLSLLRPDSRFLPPRRTALRWSVLAVLGLTGGGALLRALTGARDLGAVSRVTGRSGAGHPEPITPVGSFYSISKNFFDPVVDKSGWKLEVTGLVRQRLELTADQLRARPQYDQLQTLMCISNEIGGDLISNGAWRGVRLGELLSSAGVETGAVDVVFTCADDYTDSITIAKAMEPGTLLALDMNGAPLTDKHGAPLRCVVPNIFGMKNAKWIRKIEVVGTDYQGFWQRQGWSDSAEIVTMSRIDYPFTGSQLQSGEVELGGIAFAGARGISGIELSFDERKSWQPGTLLEPIAPLSWRFWTYRWRTERSGAFNVEVRAIDGEGVRQKELPSDPYPDGATGYHRIFLRVA